MMMIRGGGVHIVPVLGNKRGSQSGQIQKTKWATLKSKTGDRLESAASA
jgi:hypothetical protein